MTVHATLCTSNWGGLELELSPCGDAVRVRDNYGQESPEVSDWIEIDFNDEGDAVFDYNNEDYNLSDFIRI